GIVFVNPPISQEERYGALSAGGSCLPPLGLCHLAAVTREHGFETTIVDSEALKLNIKETAAEILSRNPKFIGITSSTIAIHHAAKLAQTLKEQNSAAITIVGGPHVTAVPEETMSAFPQFDIGVIAEGEATIVDLLKTLGENGPLEKVKGIVFRQQNTVQLTDRREFIKDLDSLPMPAWDLLPSLPKYYRSAAQNVKKIPSASLVTTRGCPGHCTFCDRKVFGNACRAFGADYVLKMIRHLHFHYGIRDIHIKDDTFTTFRGRLTQICQALIREDWDLSWSCLARIDHVNPEILRLMKKAGCWQIQYGIESGVQEIVNLYKKGINLEQAGQSVRWTKEAGISALGFFIIGSPSETPATIEKTIKFIKELDLDDFQLSFLTPLPGSELYETARQYGSFENDWRKLCEYRVNFVPNGLTKETLEKYHRKACLEFYFRPRIIFTYLKRIKNPKLFLEMLKIAYLVLIKPALCPSRK
ncbi:MAG: cobalamin B12-binding domain-containing protein, partial [Elusimicrobia bacterium]|nr:cobalamin B12-binding domain-containing protein [Elusimicrobiota bacterium]